MNSVNILGRMTRPADLRTTGTGKSVASFSIAVNGFRKDDPASFFNVVAWAQTGDYVANYGGKGRLVAVSGRLSQRKYTTSDGQQREVVEIIAENVSFVDSKRDDVQDAEDPYDPHSEVD
jgi:single-strand DNA-binding protein